MTFIEILLTIAVALIIGLIFYYVFKISGPWGSFWTFLLILVLAGISAELWIRPIGPVYYEFAWLPTLFVILLFALLLGAVSPRGTRTREAETPQEEKARHILALSGYFWFFLLFLVFAIMIGLLF